MAHMQHGKPSYLPGGGPPPHVHSREEEGFYILEETHKKADATI